MKIILIFASILVTQVTSQIASCTFEHLYIGPYIYGCGLTLYNPLFLEVDELVGEHLEEKEEEEGTFSDSDVLGVIHYNGTIGFFPSVICQRLINVEYIDLYDSGLRAVLDDSFNNCRELKWLALSENQINSISDNAFVVNIMLEHLDLSNATLRELPVGLFDTLESLETLIIEGNPLGDIPNGIFKNLIGLQLLNMRNTGLTAINPNWFEFNTNLSDLNLSGNEITTISREMLSTITSVQFLYLSENKIQSLASDTLADLTNLSILDLSFNEITQLVDGTFNGQPALTILDLNYNHIDELPLGIFAPLVSLRYLRLSGNKLTIFRRSVFCDDLTDLTMIDIHENQINAMDARIFEEARGIDYFGFLDNVCQSGSMYEFRNMRDIYLGLLKECFENFHWTVETHTPNKTTYTFYPVKEHGIEIHVKSDATVQIALAPFGFAYLPIVEIIIGTARNGRSIIRRNLTMNVVEVATPRILNEDGFSVFRVTWKGYVVKVFEGESEEPFMSFAMVDKYDVKYYGIETPECEGDWNIEPIWSLK